MCVCVCPLIPNRQTHILYHSLRLLHTVQSGCFVPQNNLVAPFSTPITHCVMKCVVPQKYTLCTVFDTYHTLCDEVFSCRKNTLLALLSTPITHCVIRFFFAQKSTEYNYKFAGEEVIGLHTSIGHESVRVCVFLKNGETGFHPSFYKYNKSASYL